MDTAPPNHSTGFNFLHRNPRPQKPRTTGLTEIRAAYYSPFGYHYFLDLLNAAGQWIDSIKFAGGAFAVMNPEEVQKIIRLAHEWEVQVSTGGFIEYVLPQGRKAVQQYLQECKSWGFDIVELSTGFISLPIDDWCRLVGDVQQAGLKAKPEIGIQWGAGGDTATAALAGEEQQNPQQVIAQARKLLEAGACLIMVESEGITENVEEWRTEVPTALISELGAEKLMFEAADPEVFSWYVKHYGMDVNLFVDHSQLIQLECLRQGLWGKNDVWGRIQSYR